MAELVRLIYPLVVDGETVSSLRVRRPTPIAFARFYRAQDPLEAVRMFGLPCHVVDELHPTDGGRLQDAMKRQTRIYIWIVAWWLALTGSKN